MSNNSVFNAAVCIMGILILTIHVINLLVKKEKRKDEYSLLNFFLFTILHFATYLTFTIVKLYYTSNAYILAFYTIFYIMNNMELFLLFRYMQHYVELESKLNKILTIVNICLFGIFVILDFVNIGTGIFFTANNGEYLRSSTMIISQGYQFIMFTVVFFVTILNKKLKIYEKIAFAVYCLLPLIAIVLQNIFKGYAIAYLSIIIAIEVLFLFSNVQRNMELSKQKQQNAEAQIKLMLSQIQPHFIYNSLSSISTLITIDPDKAQNALDDFTEYLRHNLSSLTETRMIPFSDELRHIRTYIHLEKVRFGKRVNVIYDIQVKDFEVPPLSIQPIVENAVKHGILKKIEGGTLTIKTYEDENSYYVEIIDDGIGFNIDNINFSENKHIGLKNIQYRLTHMCGAELKVNSEEGKGTDITVRFNK